MSEHEFFRVTDTSNAVPMTSTKLPPRLWRFKEYLVLGTTHECVIEMLPWKGCIMRVDGVKYASFPTKKRALQYCQEHPEL